MSTQGALRISLYLLVADGVAALYLGALLDTPGLVLVVGAVVASWWREALRHRLALLRRLRIPLLLGAVIASALDILYLAETVLIGLVHFLLFLLVYRLFTARSLRDARDVGFVCFFMLVAAAPVSVSIGYLGVFVVFLVAGTWMLMLRHVLVEAEAAATGGPEMAGDLGLLRLSLIASVTTLAIAATLFLLIPRIGQAALPFHAKVHRMVSGFSDRVQLGSFGEIETDSAVAMRVQFPDGPVAPDVLTRLRWRGIALDHFDGRAWTVGRPERMTVGRSTDGAFNVGAIRGRGLLLMQQVFLEPIGSDVIFGAPRMLRVALRTDTVAVDAMGGVSAPRAPSGLQYVVESELEGVAPGRVRSGRDVMDAAARARYLQLPAVSPRVGDLARDVTASARDAREAAAKLTVFLSTRFHYTRAPTRQTALPPVDEFLLVRRSGNCEYFAAALAVMLRTLDIPARVVNGFQRGEWNPYGGYFMVRLLDAHSWVEAYLDDAGWVTLDPSPRGEAEWIEAPGAVDLYFDSFRMRWYRYVMNWSRQDQLSVAVGVTRMVSGWKPSLAWAAGAGAAARAGAVAAAVLIAVGFVMRRKLSRATTKAAARIPRFYERALRVLARRGLRPAPTETAREFAARVETDLPSCADPMTRLTEAYERARFGGVALTGSDATAIDECVAALSRHEGPIR